MKKIFLSDIIKFLTKKYPLENATTWDHPGLQIGNPDQEVKKILTTLDVTPQLVQTAVANNIDTIISHHPLIFHPIKTIDLSHPRSQMNAELIKHNINVFSIHTNFDDGEPGMNDFLAELLNLKNVTKICPGKTINGINYFGRMGETNKSINELIKIFRDKLKIKMIKFLDNGRQIKKVGIIGGAGASGIKPAFESGADLFITGDVKHHDFLEAQISHYAVLDVGHVVEKIFALKMVPIIQQEFPTLTVKSNKLSAMEIPNLEDK